MVRPSAFGFNPETAATNSFQRKNNQLNEEEIHLKALHEFDSFVYLLKSNEIEVTVIQDTAEPATPDSIFPNNVFSKHENTVVFYSLLAKNRQLEREKLSEKIFNDSIHKHVFIENIENENLFLEGTGSIVFDYENKIAYASFSPRTSKRIFEMVCHEFNYKPVSFHSFDENKKEIYHTNVMMTIGKGFAVVCEECISNKEERQRILSSLKETNHELITIDYNQLNSFAGNMYQLFNKNGESFIIMSNSAYKSLREEQLILLEKYGTLLHPPLDTIEKYGGGSARCMIAEIGR